MRAAPSPALGNCDTSTRSFHFKDRLLPVRKGGNRPLRLPARAAVSRLDDSGTKDFLDWASKAGIVSTHLSPNLFTGLRGLGATDAVKQGDVLISVPRKSSVLVTPRMRCPFPDFVDKEHWEKSPWFVKLALQLLQQKREAEGGNATEGGAPRLAGYLAQLPKVVDLPVLWSDQALQALQYPHLFQMVKDQQVEWAKLHEELQKQSGSASSVTKAELYWAMSCVRSRTFSGPYIGSTLKDRVNLALFVAALVLTNATLGLADVQQSLSAAASVFIFNILYELVLSRTAKQYAMCPLIDFVNHSSQVESEVSYDYFSDTFSVTASRDYKAGDQVFVNYGQTNDGLMQYYGFAEVDNAKDVYVMTNLLKWLDEVSPADQRRLGDLNSVGLLNALQTVTVARAGFPGETLQALRYLLTTAEGGASSSAAASSPSAFASPGSPELEARLAGVLVHACERELRSLGSTVQEDTALLASPSSSGGRGASSSASPSSSSSERMAVAFRLEKKKVLLACLKNLGVDYRGVDYAKSSGGAQTSKGGQGKGFA